MDEHAIHIHIHIHRYIIYAQRIKTSLVPVEFGKVGASPGGCVAFNHCSINQRMLI
jgi:hypothetical protein